MESIILILVTFFIIVIVLITVALVLINNIKNKKFKAEINKLDVLKNTIINIPILTELNKVEALVKNKKLEEKYQKWHDDFKNIREKKMPKITDMLLEADDAVDRKKYNVALNKIAKVELEIHNLKTKSSNILNEIKDFTTSEEKNRNEITLLKAKYREILTKFNNNKLDYGEVKNAIETKFNYIEKSFNMFEKLMEANDFDSVKSLTKAISNNLDHLILVVEQASDIILLGRTIIPKRIESISKVYSQMLNDGYQLNYLKIEYNIAEIGKKINDVFVKLKELKLDNSLLELKVFVEYFDDIYKAFEKERQARKEYDSLFKINKKRIMKINRILEEILTNLETIRSRYNVDDQTLTILDTSKNNLSALNYEFHDLIEKHDNKEIAFSILLKELNKLSRSLNSMQDQMDNTISCLGNMHEDEERAREQLEEIKELLRKAKFKMRSYKLPILNDNYFIELKEASEAIREVVREIERKPINIEVLNIRVDTARDLAFKFYKTTTDMIKNAKLLETTLVFSNKYRLVSPNVSKALDVSYKLFYEGEYTNALNNILTALETVNPGIGKKILEFNK